MNLMDHSLKRPGSHESFESQESVATGDVDQVGKLHFVESTTTGQVLHFPALMEGF